MANTKNDRRLFNYIHSIGPACGHKGVYVFDNTGPMAEGGNSYLVFMQGGICFEIHKEKTTAPDFEYWIDIHWQGPFAAESSTDIIATLIWLRHELPQVD